MSWVKSRSGWRTVPLVPPAVRDQILRDFKSLFQTTTSERSLKKTVKRDSGTHLRLGIPHDWWLVVTPRGELMEMEGVDLRPLLPTAEWVVVIGELRSPVVGRTSLYVAMGKESRMFLYSAREDSLELIANDVDQFSRIGLSMSEFVFKMPSALPPRPVTDTIWNTLCGCENAAELLKILSRLRNSVLRVRTPVKLEDEPMLLLDRYDLCCEHWPFSGMGKRRLTEIVKYLDRRLSCRWHTMGLLGTYKDNGVFHATFLILFDDRMSLYYLSVATGEAWRLADSVRDFERMGLLKIINAGRRVDREWTGAAKLEHPPDPTIWFHARRTALHLCVDVCPPSENQSSHQFAWIAREGRSSLETEEETALADSLMRRNLALMKDGQGLFPTFEGPPHTAATTLSLTQQLAMAAFDGDDDWRPSSDDDDDRDGLNAALPPFRETVLPDKRSEPSVDLSEDAMMRRRVLASSASGNCHAPVMLPPDGVRPDFECPACVDDHHVVQSQPPAVPQTPAPRRRIIARLGLENVVESIRR